MSGVLRESAKTITSMPQTVAAQMVHAAKDSVAGSWFTEAKMLQGFRSRMDESLFTSHFRSEKNFSRSNLDPDVIQPPKYGPERAPQITSTTLLYKLIILYSSIVKVCFFWSYHVDAAEAAAPVSLIICCAVCIAELAGRGTAVHVCCNGSVRIC